MLHRNRGGVYVDDNDSHPHAMDVDDSHYPLPPKLTLRGGVEADSQHTLYLPPEPRCIYRLIQTYWEALTYGDRWAIIIENGNGEGERAGAEMLRMEQAAMQISSGAKHQQMRLNFNQ